MYTIAILLLLFVFLFYRQVKIDRKKYFQKDRQNDAEMLKKIEAFLKDQIDTKGK